ncbi:MAG: sn-glycerol-3-phosphate ABC transporter ATP-binding protein UgpC [Mesorhizobium sp.]|nr:MAG: sn-glycerol-3-phosphate ABC transporter ATP-binding protein UgpC [Mesorhizobium sp.]
MARVELNNIGKAYGAARVIDDVSFTVEDGEFVVFVGPSGCGKSTLLRLIAGLDDPSGGDILIAGNRVNDRLPRERGIAMVFQSYALYPHMTVSKNMAFGLELAGTDKATIEARVKLAAEILDLAPLMERLPKQLSGGQRQRVAIGRAIVREPKVFLFDEPLSNLDAALRVQMRIEIARLQARLGATTIYVTHDQVEAMTLASKIVVLNAGRVEQVGAPLELYDSPANLFVAGFIGSPKMNFIEAEVTERSDASVGLRLPGGKQVALPAAGSTGSPEEKLTLGIRPEHIVLRPNPVGQDGMIEFVEELGDCHHLYVRFGGEQTVTVRGEGKSRWRLRDPVQLVFDPERCHLFGSDGRALTCKRRLSDVVPVDNQN